MDVAISYLQRLWNTGYFSTKHSFCDNLWIENHPACANAQIWEAVKHYLIENGYIKLVYPVELEASIDRIHAKDEMDLWWLEITEKGTDVCAGIKIGDQ